MQNQMILIIFLVLEKTCALGIDVHSTMYNFKTCLFKFLLVRITR